MTNELRQAVQKLRDANDVSLLDHAEEVFTEALHHYAEQCRRDAIERCSKIARLRGAGDAADDMLAMLEA